MSWKCPYCNEELDAISYEEKYDVAIEDDGTVYEEDMGDGERNARFFCPSCNKTLSPEEDFTYEEDF